MELHNSGVDIFIWQPEIQEWTLLEETLLEEAKSYRWRCVTGDSMQFLMQNVPLSMLKTDNGWEGTFETPFQSGFIHFKIRSGEQVDEFETYVYPDERKITIEQYEQLLREILEEAMICFQNDGLDAKVNALGFTRNLSMLQWNYIEQQIYRLRMIFRKIDSHPLRVLRRTDEIVKRELIKQVSPKTLSWMDRYGESYGGSHSSLPSHLKSSMVEETFNVYENRVVLAQLNELQILLKKYSELPHSLIKQKAVQYYNWIMKWKEAEFLNNIQPYIGSIKTTQAFRKHPIYRLWYQWFQDLYNFKEITFDLKNRLPLKDTYQLYEIWCFMQIVKCLRELDLLGDTTAIFTYQDDYYYLNLSENKESVITLKNGAMLSYQKIIQSNTKPYYSYTQRMIPDIVLEYEGVLYVLDPKYRVAANLSMALGEMHKYRDGILHRETNQKVVKEVYILTPRRALMSMEKDFYKQEFQHQYKMGAFSFMPGGNLKEFKQWISGLFF